MSKSLGVFIMGVLLACNAEAAMVSFLVIETGLPEETGRVEHSGIWESSLMDAFFDAGHIVSNASMMRMERSPVNKVPEEITEELNAAKNSGADFVIVALLDYESSILEPREICLLLYKINPYQKIVEQHFPGEKYKSAKDEFDSLKKIAKGLVPHLKDR
jgi:hypothetical protein